MTMKPHIEAGHAQPCQFCGATFDVIEASAPHADNPYVRMCRDMSACARRQRERGAPAVPPHAPVCDLVAPVVTAPRMSAERLVEVRAYCALVVAQEGGDVTSDLLAELDTLLTERDQARRQAHALRAEACWAEPTEKKFWPLPWE